MRPEVDLGISFWLNVVMLDITVIVVAGLIDAEWYSWWVYGVLFWLIFPFSLMVFGIVWGRLHQWGQYRDDDDDDA